MCTLLPIWEARDYLHRIWVGVTKGHRSDAPATLSNTMDPGAMKRAQSEIPLTEADIASFK